MQNAPQHEAEERAQRGKAAAFRRKAADQERTNERLDDIAGRLQCTPKAAESLLTRARNAFRDAFAAVQAAGKKVLA